MQLSDKKPKAVLLTFTAFPIETVYVIWQRSKVPGFNMTVEQVKQKMQVNPSFDSEVIGLFKKILHQGIPIGENLDFVFMIEDDPIAHREQMVRHRIGVKFGDNFGVDIIPEFNQSSYWSNSMRIDDFSNFVDDEKYFVPESVEKSDLAKLIYRNTLRTIQDGYRELVGMGIPMEDARGLLPLHSTMNISWKVNLTSLLHIIGKRSCWILQYGYWGYIIKSMVDQLAEKVHPVFRDMVLPQCFVDGKFTECVFKLENERRLDGRDKLPLCPLYYAHNLDLKVVKDYKENYPEMCNTMEKLSVKYSELWGRDAYTGEDKRTAGAPADSIMPDLNVKANMHPWGKVMTQITYSPQFPEPVFLLNLRECEGEIIDRTVPIVIENPEIVIDWKVGDSLIFKGKFKKVKDFVTVKVNGIQNFDHYYVIDTVEKY